MQPALVVAQVVHAGHRRAQLEPQRLVVAQHLADLGDPLRPMCRVSSPRSTTTRSIASSKPGYASVERVDDLVEVAAVRPRACRAAPAGGGPGRRSRRCHRCRATPNMPCPAGLAGGKLGRCAGLRADRRRARPVRRRPAVARWLSGSRHSLPTAVQVRPASSIQFSIRSCSSRPCADGLRPLRAQRLVEAVARRHRAGRDDRPAPAASSTLRPAVAERLGHDLLVQLAGSRRSASPAAAGSRAGTCRPARCGRRPARSRSC